MRFIAGLMYLTVVMPGALASQSEADTVVVHSVYAGEPLLKLVSGVASLAKGAFRLEDAELIQKRAWQQSDSLSNGVQRQLEPGYAYKVRGRSRKSAVLAIYLLSTQSYFFDVRIQVADSALMQAIRAHLAELAIDSLIPIDRVRLTLSEERLPGTPPRLFLGLRTVREFSCLGYYIDHDMRRGGVDTIYLNLHGVAAKGDVCPAMVGPATMSRELSLLPGKYKLLVTYRGRRDRLILDLSDTATAVIGLDSSLVEADERPRWRYPRNSFAFHCGTLGQARDLCADAQAWLGRQPGITRYSFAQGAINPYSPDPASRPDQGITFFLYDREISFERLRLCFGAIDNEIREAVGVFLSVEDWRGVSIGANSRRSFHQRHIEVPKRVSDIPACRTPAWSD